MEEIHIKNAEAFEELEALSEKLRADSARLNKAVRWRVKKTA